MKRPLVLGLTVIGLVWLPLVLPSQRVAAQAPDDPSRDIVIAGPGRDRFRIAVADSGGSQGAESATIASRDFDLAGYFQVLNPASFSHLKGENFLSAEPQNWRSVGAQAVSKGRSAGGQIEFKLYTMDKGARAVLERTYPGGGELRNSTHRWCNEVVKLLSGDDGVFGTQLAFVGGNAQMKNVYVMDFDGYGVHRVTTGKLNILPSWGPGGGGLLYTTYAHLNPDLYFISSGGGKGRRIASYPGLNTGGVYSPDGSKIAVTLSKDGNAEIYILSTSGSVISRLTNHPGIDSSPAWSPDGSKIAFVSDRNGGPQIFVMSAGGGGAKRVTWQGNYNTTPVWNPRRDKQEIAFTGRDEKQHFDIFVHDLAANQTKRVTQAKGDNQAPTWAPNGRLLAYTSNRGGLYVNTVDGNNEKKLVSGRYSTPVWGPMRRR